MRRRLIGVLVLVVLAGCGGGGSGDTTEVTEVPATTGSVAKTTGAAPPTTAASATTDAPTAGGDIAGLIGAGDLEVATTSPEGGVSGRIFQVQVTNTGTGEVEVIIPCGLVFEPAPGVEEQRMMVVQAASSRLGLGESVSLTPYVMCIDGDLAAASEGAAYSIGTFAPDELRAFAECICEKDLDAQFDGQMMGDIGLQLAVWELASGGSEAEDYGPLAEGLEGFDLELFAGIPGFEALVEVMKDPAAATAKWLEECGIAPKS